MSLGPRDDDVSHTKAPPLSSYYPQRSDPAWKGTGPARGPVDVTDTKAFHDKCDDWDFDPRNKRIVQTAPGKYGYEYDTGKKIDPARDYGVGMDQPHLRADIYNRMQKEALQNTLAADPNYDMTKSVMEGWIQTYTGRRVWPLKLTPDQISLDDIAHALSMKVRFTGHCTEFYSIAEHSVHVAKMVRTKEALMHDAAEYILPDVARPIKHMLPGFKELEHQVEKCIAERFGLQWPWPTDVKRADNAMVLCERQQIMVNAGHRWDVPGEPANIPLRLWCPEMARREFLKWAFKLGIK